MNKETTPQETEEKAPRKLIGESLPIEMPEESQIEPNTIEGTGGDILEVDMEVLRELWESAKPKINGLEGRIIIMGTSRCEKEHSFNKLWDIGADPVK